MKIYHNTQIVNGKDVIMLYVDYPAEYEFSLDFKSLKENVLNVTDKIREYAVKNFKNLTNDTTILILNGVALGTLLTAALINKINVKDDKNTNISPSQEIVETVENVDNVDNSNNSNTTDEKVIEENKLENVSDTKKDDEKSNQEQATNKASSSAALVTTPKQNATVTETKKTTSTSPAPATNTTQKNNTSSSTPKTTPATQSNEKMISLKLNSGQVVNISLEDYVTGVVSAEMPASFNTEALKAQAVAARTYALKKSSSGLTLSANTSDQVYKTENELRSMWGNTYNTYYTKVKNAVNATKGEYLTYNGKYIEALYFSTSNGRTENAENVFKDAYPYLVSVESPFDVGIPSYSGSKTVAMSTISEKLGVNLTSISQIKILEKTQGDRVKKISICDKTYTGVQIRTMFGLKSADFDVKASGNNIVFTTRGYGHGVGMSQYGANLMAKAGYSYKQILQHYYTGVKITK